MEAPLFHMSSMALAVPVTNTKGPRLLGICQDSLSWLSPNTHLKNKLSRCWDQHSTGPSSKCVTELFQTQLVHLGPAQDTLLWSYQDIKILECSSLELVVAGLFQQLPLLESKVPAPKPLTCSASITQVAPSLLAIPFRQVAMLEIRFQHLHFDPFTGITVH